VPPTVTLPRPAEAADGAEVLISGRFEIHPLYGPLQFVATTITIRAAQSDTVRLVATTVDALQRDGSVAAQRSLAIPQRPHRIGLVAPLAGGAGGSDFLDRLHATQEIVQLKSRYVPMGGPAAVDAVVEALRELSVSDVELIFVCRGGGARSDLATFDAPDVLATICAMPVPVIVGAGHATDRTAADEVCHMSLPTSSAAAAWLIDRRRQTERDRLTQTATQRIRHADATQQRARTEMTSSPACLLLSEEGRVELTRDRSVRANPRQSRAVLPAVTGSPVPCQRLR